MAAIERLWEDFDLPVRDSLHFADGHSCDVALDSDAPSGLRVLAPFDLDETLESDPSLVSSVDGLAAVDLGRKGLLWGGEGSYGSEGFIARLTVDRALMWAIFFMESNPFDRIRLSNNVATFSSTSGTEITVDIDDPRTPISGPASNRTA
ncbi:hypothetical protein [Streptomyces xantholiticus]|uniref:hypothetical protein n=1 Tax=Streptomyces xantholiticus TaxID=68285 RepID=UPI001672AF9F|nr:hypothetical protein [Streptomyces xantholiticus]GGW40896.1 hypothetical protein GCM10010381_27090 [Streptomyces xantholiticus]